MNYQVSELAIEKAKSILVQQQKPEDTAFRLYIEGKECDGFVYGICLDVKTEGDLDFDFEGMRLVVDKQTNTFTKNIYIDWHELDGKEGFKIENPEELKYRGKFFKRKAWQDLLEKPSQ